MSNYYIPTPTKEIYDRVVLKIRGTSGYHDNFNAYKENTAITVKNGCFQSVDYYIEKGYIEMFWQEFLRERDTMLIFN